MLNYERYHYPCPIVQKRLHALYMKGKFAISNEDIGLFLDAHRNSISEWISIYLSEGYNGIIKVGYGTNKSELEKHAVSLIDFFTMNPPRSLNEAILKTKELTNIERSATSMRSFMKRHKFRFLQTGHIPAKVNTTQQLDWVDTTLKPVIAAALNNELHLFFLDAAHFTLQPFLCRLWCIARVFIKASPGRNRINVLGAVNAITKDVSTYINTTYINADSIIAFLKQLREQYKHKPIAIILDNARYQHCWVVKMMAQSFGIHLLFLPPYSPNLNIIERLWKFTKKEILNAKYYENPPAFHQAIESFFKTINQTHNIELQKFLTLKFQFFHKTNAHSYAA